MFSAIFCVGPLEDEAFGGTVGTLRYLDPSVTLRYSSSKSVCRKGGCACSLVVYNIHVASTSKNHES